MTGTKTLTVRNWFPGMWYVRERKRSGAGSLHLFCQTETGGWTDAGQVRSSKRSDTASHHSCTTMWRPLAGCVGGGALGAAVSRRASHDRRAHVQRTSLWAVAGSSAATEHVLHSQVLISKLDAAHSRPFKEAAAMFSSLDEPMGMFRQLF